MVVPWPRIRRWQWVLTVFLLVGGFVGALQFRAGRVIRKAYELPTVRVRELAVLVRQQDDALATLQAEVHTLRGKLSEYETAAAEGRVAADTLGREVNFYQLVLGLTPVEGPGVLVRVTEDLSSGRLVPPSVQATDLAGLVNELWAAGAEAVAVNGHRILATTGFRQDPEGISAGLDRMQAPFDVQAIGDPASLRSALSLRAGFVEGLRSVGVAVEVVEQPRLVLPPYNGPLGFRHASPFPP